MIRLACSVTQNYLPRARLYLESMARHEPRRSTVFCVDYLPKTPECPLPEPLGRQAIFLPYDKVLNNPKCMCQAGQFTAFASLHWANDDVVIFTDADALLQRSLTEPECELLLEKTRHGGVMIGRNDPEGRQTLDQEAPNLWPKVGTGEQMRRFPWMEGKPCRNTGFVVARLETWRELYLRVQRLWPAVHATWTHWASVQMAIMLAIHADEAFRLEDAPLSMHSHDHLGRQPGITIDHDGTVRHEGRAVFFSHAYQHQAPQATT